MHKLIGFISTCLTCTLFSTTLASSNSTTIYLSQGNKSEELAQGYCKTGQCSNRYLAYRDIPSFIDRYSSGTKTLDYGAGTGFSTEFLLAQNLEVTGVDISQEMLAQAKINLPNTPFYLIQNNTLPFSDNSFDVVFSSLVLFELGSEKEMLTYLEEAKRVMKNEGVFIAVTGSQDMYSKDWFTFNVNYPENKNLKSGDLAKIYLYQASIEFTDFYWTEADYRRFFKKAGLDLLEIHYPLGKDSEQYLWKDEKTYSPFVVFVAKKN